MKLLNVGCGSTFHPRWTNVDMDPQDDSISAFDVRRGLPYADGEFDACYSSHVLEHLKRTEAQFLLAECRRVLKPGGIMRVVVPDLEGIVREYLRALERLSEGQTAEADYDWMMLELYDQTVRHWPGGEMGRVLAGRPGNHEFISRRIGLEAEKYWRDAPQARPVQRRRWTTHARRSVLRLRLAIAKMIVSLVLGRSGATALSEGWFRSQGEIHRWMYDRFSLARLLSRVGFSEITVCRAHQSAIPGFETFELDAKDGAVRKPDSLFIEAKSNK